MAHINEEIFRYLNSEGYTTGNITERLTKALQTETGSTDPNLNSLWVRYLTAEGYTVTDLPGAQYKWLGDKGYTQTTLSERITAACIANDLLGWNPSKLWQGGTYMGDYWDFSDAANLRQNSDGSIAVNNTDVVGYALGSVNGRTCLQASTPAKPTFEVSTGKRSGIVMRDAAQLGHVIGTPFAANTSHTLAMSVRQSDTPAYVNGPRLVFLYQGATRSSKMGLTYATAPYVLIGGNARASTDSLNVNNEGGAVTRRSQGVVYNSSGNSTTVYRDALTTTSPASGTQTGNLSSMMVGDAPVVGTRAVICELVMINRALTLAEMTKLWDYFARAV